MVFVANPNNPTGTWVPERAVEKFLAALPAGVIAVFDEAYYEYVARRTFPDILKRVRAGQPVFSLRTFSKAYGIAGLRIGYLVGPPEYVAEMNKVREPFNTNHLAQVAAVAALADERHLRRVVRLNRKERERLGAELTALGLDVIPSEANFLLVGHAPRRQRALPGVVAPRGHRPPGRQLRVSPAPEGDGGRPRRERPLPRRAARVAGGGPGAERATGGPPLARGRLRATSGGSWRRRSPCPLVHNV